MEDVAKPQFSFSADEALMYLIQQTTKMPTEEILGFFYDLGIKIGEMGAENMETNQGAIRKDIRDLFPNTCVPFKLLVKGHKQYINTPSGWKRIGTIHGSIEVSFPDKARTVDHKALIEKIIERTLLDGESLPNFPKPKPRANKMYKGLIEEILKNKDKI
jgi:hypothetical protein